MDLTLEGLGLTKEDLQARVVDRICSRLETEFRLVDGDVDTGEAAHDEAFKSPFIERIEAMVKQRIEDAVAKLADEKVLPAVPKLVEAAVMTPTNKWGEPKAEPMTFVEFMEKRFNTWLEERVDSEGRSNNGYSERGQTRLVWAIDKHLQYTLKSLVENVLKEATSTVTASLVETCKAQLELAAKRLKVEVKT